jgi:hypothetical protein
VQKKVKREKKIIRKRGRKRRWGEKNGKVTMKRGEGAGNRPATKLVYTL